MAKLIYSAIASLDGYTADKSGKFDWSVPDEQVHRFVNDHERGIGTYLYGRKLYDVMVAWETIDTAAQPDFVKDYAQIWRSAEKVVFSRALAKTASERTRIARSFDPEAIRKLKTEATRDVSVGGTGLAAQALRAGLVDDIHLFLSPVIVGGGIQALPDDLRLDLELLEQRQFDNGVVYLHYRTHP